MESNSPGGAVDRDFDDAARDGEAVLNERLDDFPRDVQSHDVAIDMAHNRPLFVRRKVADSAADYFDEQDFDLTTYKAHPWLPITPDDPVFECVYVPTKTQDIPGDKGDKTYDFPRGRLARVPVEWLYSSDVRPQDDAKAAMLAAMFANAGVNDGEVDAVADVAFATFDDRVVVDGLERAGFDSGVAGYEWGSSDDVGDFDG